MARIERAGIAAASRTLFAAMRSFARRFASGVLSLIYPPHCEECGVTTEAGIHLCVRCADNVKRIEAPFCATCSQPFDGAITGTFTCANCADRKFHFECAVSRHRARGAVRDFIHRFKYEGRFYLRHQLAEWLDASLGDERLLDEPLDALVPVPLHATRRRDREFNQAEVLARLVAARHDLAVALALARIRPTPTQTALDREERMENLRNAFAVRDTAAVRGKRLVLVDDVLTTGSTLDECARVLRQAGALTVRAITVARG